MATQANNSAYFGESEPLNSELLSIYDLNSQDAEAVKKFSLEDGYVRYLPPILKDGGGKKLMFWNEILLAVCPEVTKLKLKSNQKTHQPSLLTYTIENNLLIMF